MPTFLGCLLKSGPRHHPRGWVPLRKKLTTRTLFFRRSLRRIKAVLTTVGGRTAQSTLKLEQFFSNSLSVKGLGWNNPHFLPRSQADVLGGCSKYRNLVSRMPNSTLECPKAIDHGHPVAKNGSRGQCIRSFLLRSRDKDCSIFSGRRLVTWDDYSPLLERRL